MPRFRFTHLFPLLGLVLFTAACGESKKSRIPATPTDLTVTTVSGTELELVWSDNAYNETGYRIERSLDAVTYEEVYLTAMNVSAHTDFGLAPSTRYFYRVRATNPDGD